MEKNKSLVLCGHIPREAIQIGLEVSSREELLACLAREAESRGLVLDARPFLENLALREVEMSTGVGRGLAVPHAEVAGAKETFIIVATLKRAVDYESLDQEPVDVVFLIGGKPGEVGLHLQLLSRIARLARQPQFLTEIKEKSSPEALFEMLEQAETTFYEV